MSLPFRFASPGLFSQSNFKTNHPFTGGGRAAFITCPICISVCPIATPHTLTGKPFRDCALGPVCTAHSAIETPSNFPLGRIELQVAPSMQIAESKDCMIGAGP